jgi:hypothetical protein
MNSVVDLSDAERSNYLSTLASSLEATADYAARRTSKRKGIEGIVRTLQPPATNLRS